MSSPWREEEEEERALDLDLESQQAVFTSLCQYVEQGLSQLEGVLLMTSSQVTAGWVECCRSAGGLLDTHDQATT